MLWGGEKRRIIMEKHLTKPSSSYHYYYYYYYNYLVFLLRVIIIVYCCCGDVFCSLVNLLYSVEEDVPRPAVDCGKGEEERIKKIKIKIS